MNTLELYLKVAEEFVEILGTHLQSAQLHFSGQEYTDPLLQMFWTFSVSVMFRLSKANTCGKYLS